MFSLRTSLQIFCALLLVVVGASPALAQRAAWAQALPGGFVDLSASISATDRAGNTYVAGSFHGQLTIDGFSVATNSTSNLDQDVFFAKFNAAGRVQWLRRTGSQRLRTTTVTNREDRQLALTCGTRGDVYVLAKCDADFTFGTHHRDSATTFLARLDPATGEPMWLKDIAGPLMGLSIGGDLAADAAGNCYLVANTSSFNAYSLDGFTVPAPPTWTALFNLVAKFNDAGQTQWLSPVFGDQRGFGLRHPAGSHYNTIDVDAQGYAVIGGHTFGRFSFGGLNAPDSLSRVPTDTAFAWRPTFGRYSPTGAVAWIKRSEGHGFVQRTASDAAGNTFVCGYFHNAGTFLGVSTAGLGYQAFLAKLTPQGQVRWLRSTSHYSGSLALDAASQPYLTGGFVDSATFGAFRLVGRPLTVSPFVVAFDTAGTVRWARTSNVALSTGSAVGGGVGVDALGRVYVLMLLSGSASGAVQDFDGQTVVCNGGALVRFDEAARIGGTVYLDANANGQRDASEPNFPRPVLVSETARPYAATSSPATGRFTVFADTGAYQLQLPQVPPHHYLMQGSTGYTGHLRAYGQTDTARTFGLAPVPNQADVRVTITPYTAARRGFVSRYRVRVENVGTTPATGQVRVQLDPLLNYLGATPAPAQQTGNTVNWNFSGLAPFGRRDFDLSTTVPFNVALGTIIRSQATGTVPNDLDPTNDVDSTRQTVIGSWDPNELTVNYSTLTPAQIAAGTELDYVIHFQNLGTDTAFTVVLTDTLPAHLLRLGTLYVVSQSHNCQVALLGNRQLVVRFDNINLPPTSVSALGSGGFIRFRVRPRPTLTPGALIPNTAHIVFDYNAPLATNRVTTLVQTPNGLVAAAEAATWSLYPNPTAGRVTIEGAPGAAITVADLLGRPVRRATLARTALTLDGLAPGLYVVRLTAADGTATSRRLVVR